MSQNIYHVRVVWACAKKDVLITMTERIFWLTLLFIPIQYLVLGILFILASDHAPTAVVMNDTGPYAQQFYQSMAGAHSFRLQKASADEAESLIRAGRIVAVVTIPANFDQSITRDRPVKVDVRINNLDTDFTKDIERGTARSITSFYARVSPHSVMVTIHERDAYRQDTGYIAYLGVSILVVAILVGGMIQSGTSCAREYEKATIQEVLLSPASRWAIIVGKMLGAFLASLGSVVVVLIVLIFVLGVWPVHWGEVIGYSVLLSVIFISCGVLLGSVLKERRLITTITLGSTLPLLFVSGMLGPISFDTRPLQIIASIFPVTYAIAGLQHAFHGFQTNTLGPWNGGVLLGFALLCSIAAIFSLSHSTIKR